MNQFPPPGSILVPTGYGKRVEKVLSACKKPVQAFVLQTDDFANVCWDERPLLFGIEIYQLAVDKKNHVKWITFHVGPMAPRTDFVKELEAWGSMVDTSHIQENAVTVHFYTETKSYQSITFR